MYNNKIDIINLKNKINNLSKDINKIRNTLETSEIKIFDLTEKIEKNKEQILNKNRELDGIGSKTVNNNNKLKNINKSLEILSKDILKLRDDLTHLKVKKAKIQEILVNLSKEIKRHDEDYINYSKRFDVLKEYINTNFVEKENSVRKINENDILIKKQKEELVLLEEDAKVYENNRKKIKLEIENVEDKLELMAVDIAKKDEEIHRNEIIYTKQNNERKFL